VPRPRSLLALACLLGAIPAGRAVAQEDTLLTEAVVQLTFENGPTEVVPAMVYNGTMMLTLRRFLALAEVRIAAFDSRDSVVVILEPSGLVAHFDPARGRLAVDADTLPLGPGDAAWSDGDLFVTTATLERVFGVIIRVEWADLTAFVGRTAGLPVVRRARRERQHAMLGGRAPYPEAPEVRPPEHPAGGALLSWSLSAATSDNYTLDVGVGAQLLGGGVELRPRVWSVAGGTEGDLWASWARAWPEQQWIRQVRLGDVQSNGRRSYFLRGFVVTNAPFIRSSEFDVEDLSGRLPAGWEVELYERGRLLGYAESGPLGGFRVPLHLRYGQNPYDLVMYGPGGEVIRQTRTIRVPFSRLPAGRLEYAVAGGGCHFEPCDGLGSLDARYGVSRRLTVQGGSDVIFGSPHGTVWQPYALASLAALPALSLTGEAVVNGHVRASAAFEPTPDLRLALGHTAFALEGQTLTTALRESHRTEGSAFWRPGALGGTLFVQAAGTRSTGPEFSRGFYQGSATARIGALRYTVGGRYDRTTRVGAAGLERFAVDLGADAVLRGPTRWLRGATARAVVSVEPSEGLGAIGGSVGRRVTRLLRADVGAGWVRGLGMTLDIGLTTAIPGPRASLRNRFSEEGTDGIVFVNGSVAWDPASRLIRWSDGGDLGRGGVTGILFLDENANGVRDAGEPGLAGIPVAVGGWPDETDEAGRFSAWDVYPYEALDITVDSLAFEDPRYTLPAARIRVRPTPNSFVSVDVPVIIGAEVIGYVLLGDAGVPGIPVLVRNLETGAEISFLTYSDGGFYGTGIPPGEYEITLSEAVAERLKVFVPPMHIFVPPGAGEKRFDNVVLRLEPQEP
jgi:hypothetical protein